MSKSSKEHSSAFASQGSCFHRPPAGKAAFEFMPVFNRRFTVFPAEKHVTTVSLAVEVD
jgi:hypothetical protein